MKITDLIDNYRRSSVREQRLKMQSNNIALRQ